MAQSGISITVKKLIDESNKVLKEVDRQTFRNLQNVGKETRKTAQKSIRKKKRPSLPGRPPRSVTGILRRTIFFWVEKGRGVVVGPISLPGSSSNIPEVLEHGGTSRGKRSRPTSIQARPFMTPAFTKTRDDIRRIWQGV